MSKKLEGKVAVVTGASKGIGAEIAKQLAAAGAAVVVNYASDKAGADRVVGEVTQAGGKAVAVKASVATETDVKTLFAEAKKAFGRVDVLVNNAGVYAFAPLEAVTAELYRHQFDTNVLGLLLASREAVNQFGPAGGSIINISSAVTAAYPPGSSVYTATKGAVDAITKVLANELGSKKVRVNAVNPGLVETEGVRSAGFDQGDMRKQMEAQTPLGRIGRPTDIAPAVVFLASDDAGWVTGETLLVAGGFK